MSPAAVVKRGASFGSPETPNGDVTAGNDNGIVAPGTCDHEHFNMALVNETLNINIDDMFNMLFSDSSLFREFIRRRRTYDVKLADWSTEPDEQGRKQRNISYTLSINLGIGPKSSPSSERQLMYPESKPGERYLLDAECFNGGVPYSDHFCTVIRYCMVRTGPRSTRLNITGRVVYLKNVFMLKGLLQRTALNGCADSFGVMLELLRQESEARSQGNIQTSVAPSRPSSLPLPKRQRFDGVSQISPDSSTPFSADSNVNHRRLRQGDDRSQTMGGSRISDTVFLDDNGRAQTSASRVTSSLMPNTTKTTNFLWKYMLSLYSDNWTADTMEMLVALLFITVLALVIVNVVLYYQMTALETTISRTLVFHRGGRSFL